MVVKFSTENEFNVKIQSFNVVSLIYKPNLRLQLTQEQLFSNLKLSNFFYCF